MKEEKDQTSRGSDWFSLLTVERDDHLGQQINEVLDTVVIVMYELKGKQLERGTHSYGKNRVT